MTRICLIIVSLSVATVWGQTNRSMADMLNSIPQQSGKLEIDTKRMANVSAEFEKICYKNGGPEAAKIGKKASANFMECAQNLVIMRNLESEIEDAKPTGKVDEVFKKHCAKSPVLMSCVANLTKSSKPCFPAEQNNIINSSITINLAEEMIGFVCFKEGDRIALFISEGGRECLTMKQDALTECANKTMGFELPDLRDFQEMESKFIIMLTTLQFDEKTCANIVNMQHCMVSVLETCPQPTTGNIVDSLFKYLYKKSLCKKIDLKTKENNSASRFSVSLITIAALIIIFTTNI